MDPEQDVISNGRRGWADLNGDPTRPAEPGTRVVPRWLVMARRIVAPAAGAALLVAIVAFGATRHSATAPASGPTARPTAVNPGPIEIRTDTRPHADIPAALRAKVASTLDEGRGVRLATSDVVGSDFFGGFGSLGLLDTLKPGAITVDVVCIGTGKVQVWVQDSTDAADAGPITALDCAQPKVATLTRFLRGADFYVYVSMDPHTVGVVGYAARTQTTHAGL